MTVFSIFDTDAVLRLNSASKASHKRKVNKMAESLTDSPSELPKIVKVYRKRYEKMATADYWKGLFQFSKEIMHDSIEGLNWKQLLDWEHRHLKYTKSRLPKQRAEMPIDIILQAKGRCGEFALLYNGLLLANDYQTRLIVDCSILRDKSKKVAGDHVWVEILIDGKWIHVDPTEGRIDQPMMYALDWKKDVNMVFALIGNGVIDVTKTYRPRDQNANR